MNDPLKPQYFVRVAVAVPLHRVFDYLPPENVDASQLQAGSRVLVPFGRSRKTAIIIAMDSKSSVAPAKLKRVLEIIDQTPCINNELLSLLRWASHYYRHPLGEVIQAALPKKIRQGDPIKAKRIVWQVLSQKPDDPDAILTRAPRQAQLLKIIEAASSGIGTSQLQCLDFDYHAPLKALEKRGWIGKTTQSIEQQLIQPTTTPDIAPELNTEQQLAIDNLRKAKGFECFLLHGVTGSGKTEVYFHQIQRVLDQSKQTLVLVPEISLTPQLLSRFQRRFQTTIAVMHSGLSESERLVNWRAIKSNQAKIIIGTRSAVFAPLQDAGLIVIDEEHDSSLKQQEGFRYSARDLAIVRARHLDVPILLGSATPSLESLHNVTQQRFSLLVLSQRAGSAAPPTIDLVDLREEPSHNGISTKVMTKTQQHLAAGGQVLFFLNRRGYAPAWYCSGCGWIAGCAHCDAHMTYHQRQHQLRCHHCGNRNEAIEICPSCENPVKAIGQGTERVEEYLIQQFPDYPTARMDRDVVRTPAQLEGFIDSVKNGTTKILVGTQMLAKGHHFAGVTLVVILNADQGLFGIDFRSTERLAQTIIQVAGRAGRAKLAGEVLIQSSYPEHPLLQTLIHTGYSAFAEAALQERQQTQWPPFSHLALLRAYSKSQQRTLDFLRAAKNYVSKIAEQRNVTILGPVVAPMARRAGKEHGQLLCQCQDRRALAEVLNTMTHYLSEQPPISNVRWSLDVDPIELF